MGESMWPQWLPIRDDLRDAHPYGAPQIDVAVRLNTNENPYALPDVVVNEIRHEISRIAMGLNRYPDRDAVELRASLASYLATQGAPGLTVNQVWAANG
ncbi:MAG: histidinol-phosphate transaminase, partial [Actinobacteria bacterium]|nr:histidinol-phosphate transaminase [Actinomycetota bacterium]